MKEKVEEQKIWVKSHILCKFVLASGKGFMDFSYLLLKTIDFGAWSRLLL